METVDDVNMDANAEGGQLKADRSDQRRHKQASGAEVGQLLVSGNTWGLRKLFIAGRIKHINSVRVRFKNSEETMSCMELATAIGNTETMDTLVSELQADPVLLKRDTVMSLRKTLDTLSLATNSSSGTEENQSSGSDQDSSGASSSSGSDDDDAENVGNDKGVAGEKGARAGLGRDGDDDTS